MLALFLLEMGLVASTRIAELRTYGAFLLGFAVAHAPGGRRASAP